MRDERARGAGDEHGAQERAILADLFAIAARRFQLFLPTAPRLLVAFAEIGGTPAKTSAGKERKLPPPATLFNIPAANAASAGTTSWVADTPPKTIARRARAW